MWLKQLYNDKLGNMTVKQVLVKTVLMFIAAAVSAFGVGLFICSGLGSDPISVWLDGLDHTFHFGIGMASTINNNVTLVVAILFAFKYINVGTVINSIFFSVALGLYEPFMRSFVAEHNNLWVRSAYIALGLVFMILGLALVVSLRFGFGNTDSILFRIMDKHPTFQYRFMKIALDGCYIIAGFLMGGVVSVGTIIAFVLTGPGISACVPVIDKLILTPLGVGDHHNREMNKRHKEAEVIEVPVEEAAEILKSED